MPTHNWSVPPQQAKRLQFIAIPIVIIVILGALSFYTVGPGKRGVLLNWGAVQPGVVMPGAHFKMPFMQTVETLDVRVQKYERHESAATSDLQVVTTTVSVNYQLDPGKVDKLFKNVGKLQTLIFRVITPAVSNALKSVTARYKAENLVDNRNDVRTGVQTAIVAALEHYPVHVTAVNLTNFKFSGDYAKAIERKQVAQQQALQAKYELKKAETDAQQQVVKAKAQAQATLVAAKADAKALNMKRKVVTRELILLDAVNKWDGKMPKTLATNGNLLTMFDASRGTASEKH